MPFASKAQQRYLCATNEKLCKEFASKTPKSAYPSLPEHVANEKKRAKK